MGIIKKIIFFLFLFTSICSNAVTNIEGEKFYERQGLIQENFVLIFSSCDYNNHWASSVAKEIQKELEKADPNIFIRMTYANIGSRNSFDAERLGMQDAFTKGRATRNLLIPSALIFISEEAWMFYRIMDLRRRWDSIPVVICETRPMILSDYNSFYQKNRFKNADMIPITNSKGIIRATGIYSSNNTFRTVDLIKAIMPEIKTIIYVSDGSYSDEYTLFYLKNDVITFFPDISLKVIHETVSNADSINKVLNNLPEKTAVLVQSFQPKQTNAPVFTFNDHKPNNNFIVGGYYSLQNDYAKKTTDLLMKIRNGENPNNIPFEYLKKDNYYLNKTALDRFGLLNNAKTLNDAVFVNIPPSFFVRNIKAITFVVIILLVIIAFLLIHHFAKLHQLKLQKSHDEYKKLYDIFQIIYDNIPVGLIRFDSKGNIINRNPESDLIINSLKSENQKEFNLFKTDLFSNKLKKEIANKDEVNTSIDLKNYFLQITFRKIPSETSENNDFLAIIIDKTDLEREKKESDLLSNVFNFVIDAAALGVVEYNYISKVGYASKAWRKSFEIGKDVPFNESFINVQAEDTAKIQSFLNDAIQNKAKLFDQNIAIQGSKKHWVRCIIQLKTYAPKQGIIQFVGLCINVDELISREQELLSLMQKAKESERLKNEFIANSKNDIRLPLERIIQFSRKIIHSESHAEKEQFNKVLQKNNEILLKLIHETVEHAKRKSEEIEK